MAEPDSLTLRLMRPIDAKLARLHDDMQNLKVRMTAVQQRLAGVKRRIDRTGESRQY